MKLHYLQKTTRQRMTRNRGKVLFGNQKSTPRKKSFRSKGLFENWNSAKLLQLLSLVVITTFAVLLVPNIVANDTPKASAEEGQKLQVLTNFNQETSQRNSSQLAFILADQQEQTQSETNSNSSSNSSSAVKYIVKSGDSLSLIAQKLNKDQVEIAILNGLKTSKLTVGQELLIP